MTIGCNFSFLFVDLIFELMSNCILIYYYIDKSLTTKYKYYTYIGANENSLSTTGSEESITDTHPMKCTKYKYQKKKTQSLVNSGVVSRSWGGCFELHKIP